MKNKILWGVLLLAAALLTPLSSALAGGTSVSLPTGTYTVTTTTVTTASTLPLGFLRQDSRSDSTGDVEYRWVRFWGRDSVQAGEVCYDTSSVSPWNVTNISPVAISGDSLGIIDSTTAIFFPRNIVVGVSVATQTYGSYGWIAVRGVTQVRMTVPKQKAVAAGATGGYVGRKYTAGLPVCGSAPGVGRVATVASVPAPTLTASEALMRQLAIFGHVAVNGSQDSTLIYCYINCRN